MSIKATTSALLPVWAITATVLGGVLATPAQADGGCVPGDQAGMVPRQARPSDMVCVSPDIAALVAQENANKDAGYAGGGAYGPLTCINGLVWREAFDGDGICVTPARRTETWQENANAGVGNTGGLKPQPGSNPGGGPATQGTGSPDAALVNAVNDARLHPEKYPPRGDLTAGNGPKMTGCTNALAHSGALDNTAATHSAFIATMPADVVNVYPNMHKTASGGLAWDDGGPIQQAGYNGRWQIVADGFPNEAGAVVFWMQDDAGSAWDHRNKILDCGITDAGGGRFAGGPLGNYWTVDLGSH